MAETWFQVVDAETGAELGPKRMLLSEAQADRRTLARPENAKIARVGVRDTGRATGAAPSTHGKVKAGDRW